MATTARPPRLRANMAGHLLTWRLGAAPSYHRQTKSLTRARRNSATTRQVVTEFRLVWGQIPASLAARPSLNNCKCCASNRSHATFRPSRSRDSHLLTRIWHQGSKHTGHSPFRPISCSTPAVRTRWLSSRPLTSRRSTMRYWACCSAGCTLSSPSSILCRRRAITKHKPSRFCESGLLKASIMTKPM